MPLCAKGAKFRPRFLSLVFCVFYLGLFPSTGWFGSSSAGVGALLHTRRQRGTKLRQEAPGDHEISSAENKAPEASDHVGSTSRVEKDTSTAARERDGSTSEEQIMGQWRKFLFKYAWTLKRAVQQLVRNGKKKGASDGVRAGAGEALLKRLRLVTGARTTGTTISAAAVAEDKQGQGQEVDPPPADAGPRPDYEDYKVGDIVSLVSNFGGCSSGRLLRIEGIEEATDKSEAVVLLKSVMVGGPDDEDGINGRGERDHTSTSAMLMRVPKSATQGDARVLSAPLFSGAADEDTAIRVSLVADDGPRAGGKGSNDILQETFLFDPERNLLRPDDTYAAQRGLLRATLVKKMRQVAGLAPEDVAHFVDHVKPASASAINSTLVQELPRSFGLAAVPVQPDGSIVALRGPGGRAVRVTDLLEQVVGPLNDAIVQIGNGRRRGRRGGKGASTTTTLYSMYLELPERLPNPKRLQQEEQSKKNEFAGGSRSGRESSSWTKTQLVRFGRLFSSGPSNKSPDPIARVGKTGTSSSFIALRGGDGERPSSARSKMNTTTEAGVAEDAFFDKAVGKARGDDIQTASELVDALRFHGKCAAPGVQPSSSFLVVSERRMANPLVGGLVGFLLDTLWVLVWDLVLTPLKHLFIYAAATVAPFIPMKPKAEEQEHHQPRESVEQTQMRKRIIGKLLLSMIQGVAFWGGVILVLWPELRAWFFFMTYDRLPWPIGFLSRHSFGREAYLRAWDDRRRKQANDLFKRNQEKFAAAVEARKTKTSNNLQEGESQNAEEGETMAGGKTEEGATQQTPLTSSGASQENVNQENQDEAQGSEESEGMKNLKYAAQKLQEWGSVIAWNAGETAAGLAHDVVTERDGRGRK